ncbi:T9SS type A sorting domain-containing protein [Balneolales bacterium ANBcel1]|nr:T9SS type A sorting domain-containing protein [Balneolales bacterium ANBcel1]
MTCWMVLNPAAASGNPDIPPALWGDEGVRENMIETTDRWRQYSNTPLPPQEYATHGPRVPAFPGAEGYGAYSFGGRGGKLLRVTNLNDSGPGSFREAVTAEGPRTIIFDVSGTIELETPVRIFHPYITIAGQTAPGDGITIANRQVDIRTHDVILRHMRFRHGEGDEYRGDEWMLRTRGSNHVIMDHVTVTWGVDGNLGVTFADNVTFQNGMLAKPLHLSLHPEEERAYGALVRGRHGARYSFLRNLWANHDSRVPRPGNYLDPHTDPDGVLMDFRNNVIYQGRGRNNDDESITRYNIVNNYLLTDWSLEENSSGSQGYIDGNVLIDEIPDDQWRTILTARFFVNRDHHEQEQEFDPGSVTTLTAFEALGWVVENAGAHIRDLHDSLVVKEVINHHRSEILGESEPYVLPGWWQTGIIDHQDEVGGLPDLKVVTMPEWIDTNRNGIPDWWEREHGLDSKNPEIAQIDSKGNGYTNLEEYINNIEAIRKTQQLIAVSHLVQAESADRKDEFDAYFQLEYNDEFDFLYLEAIAGADDPDAAPAQGQVTFNTGLEGDIHIWLLVNMPSADANSFFVGFGDDELKAWSFDFAEHAEDYGNWVWAKYEPENGSLTASGNNELKVASRDVGAALDRVLFTKDPDYVPANPDRTVPQEPTYLEVLAESAADQVGFEDYYQLVEMEEEGYTYIEALSGIHDPVSASDEGVLSFHSDLEGEVRIWLLINMPDPDSNALFLGFGVDELAAWQFDYSDSEMDYGHWVWALYEDQAGTEAAPFTGSGDDHLYLAAAEAGPRLDRILFTDDPEYVPADPDREQIATASEPSMADIPRETRLRSNYPNPFNPETSIVYDLHKDQHVRIEVYNAIGQRVAVLVDAHRPAGTHTVRFGDGRLSSGVYLYRMHAGQVTQTRKMMLVK